MVDACQNHGIWLDRGELPAIVDYMAARTIQADGADLLKPTEQQPIGWRELVRSFLEFLW